VVHSADGSGGMGMGEHSGFPLGYKFSRLGGLPTLSRLSRDSRSRKFLLPSSRATRRPQGSAARRASSRRVTKAETTSASARSAARNRHGSRGGRESSDTAINAV